MDKDFCENVPDEYVRKVFTCYLNASVQRDLSTGYRMYSTLDFFPTTLSALGADIEGDRLGLGTDLFFGEETILEKYGLEKVNDELAAQSDFLKSLETIDEDEGIQVPVAQIIWTGSFDLYGQQDELSNNNTCVLKVGGLLPWTEEIPVKVSGINMSVKVLRRVVACAWYENESDDIETVLLSPGLFGRYSGKMLMIDYVWPIALVVISNIIYQICSKSVPGNMNPFASLTVTYLIAAAASAILFFVSGDGGNLWKEYGKLNWAPFVPGIVIIGLETGWIFAYRAGWQISQKVFVPIFRHTREGFSPLVCYTNMFSIVF